MFVSYLVPTSLLKAVKVCISGFWTRKKLQGSGEAGLEGSGREGSKEGCRGRGWVVEGGVAWAGAPPWSTGILRPPVLAAWGQQRPVPMVCEGMVISPMLATCTRFQFWHPWVVGAAPWCRPQSWRDTAGGGNCSSWVAFGSSSAVPCSTSWVLTPHPPSCPLFSGTSRYALGGSTFPSQPPTTVLPLFRWYHSRVSRAPLSQTASAYLGGEGREGEGARAISSGDPGPTSCVVGPACVSEAVPVLYMGCFMQLL